MTNISLSLSGMWLHGTYTTNELFWYSPVDGGWGGGGGGGGGGGEELQRPVKLTSGKTDLNDKHVWI